MAASDPIADISGLLDPVCKGRLRKEAFQRCFRLFRKANEETTTIGRVGPPPDTYLFRCIFGVIRLRRIAFSPSRLFAFFGASQVRCAHLARSVFLQIV